VLKNGITMTKMNAWWWLSAPYSVMFPLFVLVFRLKKSIGHAATLFLFVFLLNYVFFSGMDVGDNLLLH
jgi:hypothetical protein